MFWRSYPGLSCLREPRRGLTRRYDEKNHADIDLAIATSTCASLLSNKAWERWCATSACSSAKNWFHILSEWYPVAIIPIGYPASPDVPEKTRKPMEEIWEDR